MGFFERHPVLGKAVANQYQAILAAGALGLSIILTNPLPLLLFVGGNLMAFPFVFERLRRRLQIEKKFAERHAEEMSRDERLRALSPSAKARLERLRRLCDTILENYRGLSPASQGIVADQRAKFDAILGAVLKRLWLAERYEALARSTDAEAVKRAVVELERAGDDPELTERVREALEKNLEIKRQLLETLDKNDDLRVALSAELDSLEALIQLLLQKSVAATDALAFSAEIDDVLAQAEADAASIEEMERMLGSSFQESPLPSGLLSADEAAARAREAGGQRVRERLRPPTRGQC
jgi:hypothetical protein